MNRSRDMRPRRVLYVVSMFPCLSETFIVREIEQLIERGVDVHIVSLKRCSQSIVQSSAAALMPRVLQPVGWRTSLRGLAQALVSRRGPLGTCVAGLVGGLWRQPVVLGKTLVALWRTLGVLGEIERFDPDLVHAHWATYPSSIAWCVRILLDVPFSFTSHAHDIFVEDQMLARKLAEAALSVTISEFNVRYLTSRHGQAWAPGQLQVIHCGVDRRRLPDPAQAADREEGLVVCVGRLDPIKGFDVLIRALAQLKGCAVDFRCVIVGEGPLRHPLERLREELGLGSCIEMPGAMPQEQVQSLMARASVFVMPSVVTPEGNRDGIPVALMEAMAGEAAVVATRVSGIPELVADGVTGLLVEPDDAQALSRAMRRLLTDPVLRSRLGASGRGHVLESFEVSVQTERLLSHFSRALMQRTPHHVG
ncbi:glycosyltransferase [Alkalisalibacterium limincola]|uniref:Glycosyltransferase family 4 protein n=1 Tax=Alkalisalibacterium limincola TaxID=2699169 RepID=A0A5C8KYX1_9GAMM|nr:glycosyltransferase [Alkalisalibacterium limincola]TXK64475.1 glycosyltransferase family 4 protein [Alkalisalibacterium limincola]